MHAGSVDLWQARNGTATAPASPVVWVKGNASPANSHYVESQSIPYRLVLTGLAPGSHNVILEWDVRQNGKFAIDYLTHYQRLQPHDLYPSHAAAETVDPLDGLAGSFAGPASHPFPPPAGSHSPVPGQPALSFSQVPEEERRFTIWNGTITAMNYLAEADLAVPSSSTRLSIDFEAAADTVVLAWGGHIATQFDWGTGQSATSISGSPYHMRVIAVDGSVGNQDRSLQTLPLVPPPPCAFTGPSSLCANTRASFTVNYPSAAPGVAFQWSLANNHSGAVILGSTEGTTVEVQSGNGGAFDLRVTVSAGGATSLCSQSILVQLPATGSPLANVDACLDSEVTFQTTPQGTGPFQFSWHKNGVLIPGANEPALTLPGVSPEDAGQYCVEITGGCNSDVQCATL
ncbi:MAG TPA: hypothetical protein VLD18_07085, partial [Verrucomicrobiae bacterium]|nr:hypothetical protein [Verrucomicrobiae bacterium]